SVTAAHEFLPPTALPGVGRGDGTTQEIAMAFDVSSGSRVRSSVNITPLIDVVLVLLIIFMVMTPTTMKHMKPQIARESSEPAPPGPQPVTVEMTVGGY